MAPLGNARRHFWLTLGMAKATGVDLQAALYEARLTRSDYSALINRCRECPNAQDCAQMLENCQGRLEAVPEFCMNHDALSVLAA